MSRVLQNTVEAAELQKAIQRSQKLICILTHLGLLLKLAASAGPATLHFLLVHGPLLSSKVLGNI